MRTVAAEGAVRSGATAAAAAGLGPLGRGASGGRAVTEAITENYS